MLFSEFVNSASHPGNVQRVRERVCVHVIQRVCEGVVCLRVNVGVDIILGEGKRERVV